MVQPGTATLPARPAKATLPGLVPSAGPNVCCDQPLKAKSLREGVAIAGQFKGKSPLLWQRCWHADGDQGGDAAEQSSYL